MIELYDLAGADPSVRFSPYCWRTRLALAHKGLEVKTIPWRFTERQAIAFSDQARVPVLRDGGEVIVDSWAIACHLERKYADRPSLFGGPAGEAHARFINSWTDTELLPAIAPRIIADLFAIIADKDKAYFRTSREQRFGRRLEEVQAERAATMPALTRCLVPLRRTLEAQPFLGGETPTYADHIVMGTLQWPRVASSYELLEAGSPIAAWRERMLDLYGGLARKTPLAF